MSDHEQPGQRASSRGHLYKQIELTGGATAQLGDKYITYNTYNTNGEDPLSVLPFATNAPFNSYGRQYEPTCLPDTRVDLLQGIYDWADGKDRQDEGCIFWLNGLAGTGKSTISSTVARRYNEQKRLGASFFFSKGGGDYIYKAVTKQRDIASLSLSEQWRQLILTPLSNLQSESSEARSLTTVRLRVFLTSRPEIPIRNSMHDIPQAEHQDLILHKIPSTIINYDICIFLRHELKRIANEHCLGAGWPGEQLIERLVQSASGLFIWAATACRFIDEGRSLAANRLSIVLKADSVDDSSDEFSSDDSVTDDNHSDHAVAPDQHLDKLYITVIRNSVDKYKNPERKKWRKRLGTIMVTIAVLSSPLSTQSLGKVLGTTQDQIDQILNDLHAILDIPKDRTHPLRLHHPSFRDFLLDRERCKNLRFRIDEKQAHQALATKCIRLMSCLKQDICGQEAPGALVADVESYRIEQCLPLEVRYACLY
ncbi:hypothetical protein F5882DRAFT_377472 [Hyaloscypha sp. PMI_1271]|nr:hypothetical protein F5882DRAFT_377472 [Hyaloscypha sp. PMI_1271]